MDELEKILEGASALEMEILLKLAAISAMKRKLDKLEDELTQALEETCSPE